MSQFSIDRFTTPSQNHSRYERRLSQLKSEGRYTHSIETTVSEALDNIVNKTARSFVIFGEPQSGKTEMMIALTARLLDEGYSRIVVLLNDSVQLLNQNLTRFRRSGLDPAPRSFSEILDPAVDLSGAEFVVFCKKNSRDLQKLIGKVRRLGRLVVIDDEADYATPNSKVNVGEKTKINQLVSNLLGEAGIYIGVTATPARLDLNRTFETAPELWVNFPPHPQYRGQAFFFPDLISDPRALGYRLTLLPDGHDVPSHLRKALFGFMTSVAQLNLNVNADAQNYSMLIHTSGKRVDHSDDYKEVVKTLNILSNPSHRLFESYVKQLWQLAQSRYPGKEDEFTHYVLANVRRNSVIVMNSDFDKKNMDYETATNPSTLFTFAIGGNIVSRGVTFENLLSMFFTRDARHKIQQDTYIQRARMFGVRAYDLSHFELTIPANLFLDWHRCFVFHRLALASIKSLEGSPVWLADKRIAAVASASIDRSTLDMNSGEMGFPIFQYTKAIDDVIEKNPSSVSSLREIQKAIGKQSLPDYLIEYIDRFSPSGSASLAIHATGSIEGYADADKKKIVRKKGLIGKSDREETKFPKAIHHVKIYRNDRGLARVFYKYQGNISFLRMQRN